MNVAPGWRSADLARSDERLGRLAGLADLRFAPLEIYRAAIAARFGATPHVDSRDGGIAARLLLLLETPGPGNAEPRFVSRDNPTGTARNLRRFLDAAGLRRRDLLLWNTVPWIIHAPGARNRAPRRAEIACGLDLLPGLLGLLPHLRVVVTAGRVAAQAAPVLRAARPGVTLLAMPHPSPVYVNTAPAVAQAIGEVLSEAAALLAQDR